MLVPPYSVWGDDWKLNTFKHTRFGSFLLQKSWFWGKRPLTGKLPKNALPLLEGWVSSQLAKTWYAGGFPTIKFFGSQGGPGEEFSGARCGNEEVSGLDETYFRRFRSAWTLNCVTNSNVHSIGFCFDILVFGVFAPAKSHGGEMFLQSFEALNGQPWCQPPGLFPVS